MSFLRQIANLRLFAREPYASAVKPGKLGMGETPKISFKKQIDAYMKDTALRDFVDILAMQTVGMGFFTSCASIEEYRHATEGKEIVDEFNEKNGVDQLLQVTARELIGTGNSIWQVFTADKPRFVKRFPIESFESIFTNEFLELEETEFTRQKRLKLGYKQSTSYGGKLVPPENILHFRLNAIDASGWGCGIIRTMLEEYSWQEIDKNTGKQVARTRPCLMEIKAKLDTDLIEIFEKFAGPVEAWVADTKGLAAKIEQELVHMPKYGGRLVASGKLDIKTPPLEPRARFDSSIEYLWDQFCLGGQTPLPKLFTQTGFTEASARTATEIADRLVTPIQRLVKREMEKLWRSVVEAAGLNPQKAAVRLNWGVPDKPELEIDHVLKAFELKAISTEEVRKNLEKYGFELLRPELRPQPPENTQEENGEVTEKS